MKIRIQLTVGGRQAAEDAIEIDDAKLEPLTEEEQEAAIEVAVRSWADKMIAVAWETWDEREDSSGE